MRSALLVLGALVAVPATAAEPPAHPARVVIIGVDGMSRNLLEPLAADGTTPNLGRLLREGARGHLESIWPLRTPQVWTSVVTGKLPGQHGIWDHLSNTYFNPPEVRTREKLRVTSADRRSRALWNILSSRGLNVLTVGWMASWPAEADAGVLVAPVELKGDPRQTTIKGSFYKGAEQLVQPRRLESKVQRLIVDPQQISPAELAVFADVPPDDSPLYELPYLRRYVYGLRWSLARARSVEALTLGLLDDAKPDVVLSYFQCPDSLLHRFWVFQKPADDIRQRLEGHGLEASGAEELHQRFSRVVRECYRDVDARIGRILEQTRGPGTLVVVVSDHGFGNAQVPHQLKSEPFSGDHLDQGIVLAAGPGVPAGAVLHGMSVLDVTPTVLHVLGLPVGADMRGKVVDALVPPGHGAVKWIPSWETSPQLEAAHVSGWPRRNVPRRSVEAQMPGAVQRPY